MQVLKVTFIYMFKFPTGWATYLKYNGVVLKKKVLI